MHDILEEMRNEVAKKVAHEKSVEVATRLLLRGKQTHEEIAEDTDLTIEEVEALAANQTA